MAMGGFHLRDRTASEVRAIGAQLQALGIERVCPTHCTGTAAIDVFEEVFGEAFVPGGLGRRIGIEDLAAPTN